jgi:hypothetical protein
MGKMGLNAKGRNGKGDPAEGSSKNAPPRAMFSSSADLRFCKKLAEARGAFHVM